MKNDSPVFFVLVERALSLYIHSYVDPFLNGKRPITAVLVIKSAFSIKAKRAD